MFKVRNLAIASLVIVALTVPAIGTAAAQSSNEKPKATEVGVTASEIHIAVIADVDNPFAPGLFLIGFGLILLALSFVVNTGLVGARGGAAVRRGVRVFVRQ